MRLENRVVIENHCEVEKMSEKIRYYDQWAGNEKGVAEDKMRCVAEVTDFTGWHFFQCQRKRGYGPNGEYCKQHAKKIEERNAWKTQNV